MSECMKRVAKAVISAVLVMSCTAGGASVHSLYTDHRAMRVDDILTVLIMESAKAGSESGTMTSKNNSIAADGSGGSGVLGFLPSFGASAGTAVDYDGTGRTSREGSLVAKISARVIEVLDNGNLVIEGSKLVEINEEEEIIKISGIVRPQDIESNNMINSSSIADARITYSGRGTANTGQRPGIFARFFNWLF